MRYQLKTSDYTSIPVKGVVPSVLEKKDVGAKISRDVIYRHRTGHTGTGKVRHAL